MRRKNFNAKSMFAKFTVSAALMLLLLFLLFLYPNSAYAVSFETVQDLWVNGNAGIGTTGPTSKLSIVGLSNDGAEATSLLIQPDGDVVTRELGSMAFTSTDDDVPEAADYSNLTGGTGITNSPAGTINFDATELTGLTWSAGGSASFTHTYNVSTGTDPVLTFGNNYIAASTGNVGIGTTGPGAKFEVFDTYNSVTPALKLNNPDSNAYYLTVDSYVVGAGDVGYAFKTNNVTTETMAMVITGTGKVGIGTTGPSAKLDVVGTAEVTDLYFNQAYPIIGSGATDLRLYANAGERVTIKGSGNVGIGTTSPQSLLHVSGTPSDTIASFGKTNWSVDGRVSLRLGEQSGASMTNQSMWLLVGTPTYTGTASWADRAVVVADGGLGGFTIAANPGDIRFESGAGWGASYERMRITNAGNVGIGTTNPLNNLSVVKGTGTEGDGSTAGYLLRLSNHDTTDRKAGIEFHSSYGAATTYRAGGIYAYTGESGAYHDSRITIQSLNTSGGIIDTLSTRNGNVGIGTTGPNYLLEVNGTLQADDIYAGDGTQGATATVNGFTFKDGLYTSGSMAGDNLGNHTATQNIQLGSYYLSGDGGDEGVFVRSDGMVGIGTTNPEGKLEIKSGSNKMAFLPGSINTLYTPNWGDALQFYTRTTGGVNNTGQIYLKNDGNVGIGTTSPGNKLTVSGFVGIGTTSPTSAYLTTKAPDGGMIIEGNVGIGTTGPDSRLDVVGGDIDMNGNDIHHVDQLALNNGAVDANSFLYGYGGASDPAATTYGINITRLANATAGANANTVIGVSGTGRLTSNTQNWTGNPGIVGVKGTITSSAASGTITGAAGVWGGSGSIGSGITLSNFYSLYASDPYGGGTVTNAYGLYIENIDYGATQNYAIYSAGGKSYFAGNVGIGTTNPLALLAVGSTSQFKVDSTGTVTAGTWAGTAISSATTATHLAGGSAGAIPFQTGAGATSFDAANLYWNDADNRLGIGTTNPGTYKLNVNGNVAATNLYLSGPEIWSVHGDMDTIKLPISPARPYFQIFTADASNVQAERVRITRGAAQGSASMTIYEPLTVERATYLATVSGNVGIGTTAPAAGYNAATKVLVIGDGTNVHSALRLNEDQGGGFEFVADSDKLFIRDAGVAAGTNEFVTILGSNGNVGIGTTGPGLKFEVNLGGSDRTADIARFTHTNLTQGVGIGYNQIALVGTGANNPLYIDAKGTGNLLLQTTATGNVGIGTTGPGAKLEVFDTYNSATPALKLNNPDSNAYYLTVDSYVVGAGDVGYAFKTNNVTTETMAMAITGTGKVGIGTTGPSHKLDIDGTAQITGALASEADYDPLNDGLVLHIPFSEGTGNTASDKNSNGYNGAITTATWITGKFGNALSFDGASSYVELGTVAPDLDFTTEDFAIFAWVYPNTNDAGMIYDNRYEIQGLDSGWMFGLTDNGALVFDINGDNDNAATESGDGFYEANKWQLVGVVKEGTNGLFYVNGIKVATVSLGASGTIVYEGQPNHRIGMVNDIYYNHQYGIPNRYFNGKIDEVRIWKRVLSLDEIRTLYNRGLGTQAPYVALSTGNVGIGTTNPGALLDIGTAGTTLGVIRLEGSTSGYAAIQPTAAAGNVTLTLPATTGTLVTGGGTASGTNTGDQTVPANEAGAANNFLTAYNSTTGAWTKAQPTWANINKATSSLADLTTKSAGDLTSGNLAVARMPTGGNWDLTSDLTAESTTLFVGATGGAYAGNVGIGTTGPGEKLDVYGSTSSYARITSGSTSAPARRSILQLISGDSGRALGVMTLENNSTEGWFFGQPYNSGNGAGTTGFSIGFGASQAEYFANSKLYVKTDGNVGIGTVTPVGLLQAGSGPTPGLIVTGQNGNVGIGTTGPIGVLHIEGGPSSGTTPPFIIGGGVSTGDINDLYILDSKNVSTGVGYAARVIGINIQNQTDASNQVLQRTVWSGVSGAAAIYLGADDVNQGVFGVLGSPQGSTAGTVLSEYLTVRGNGNVGIGTTSPTSKLSVVGLSNDGAEATSLLIQPDGDVVTRELGTMAFTSTDDDVPEAADYSNLTGGTGITNSPTGTINFDATELTGLTWSAGGSASFTHTYNVSTGTDPVLTFGDNYVAVSTGNVGIGTAGPATRLHLWNTSGDVEMRMTADGSYDPIFRMTGEGGGTGEGFYIQYDNSVGDTYFKNIYNTTKAFHFQTNAGEKVTIKTDGNVGIGTTGPSYPLDILGTGGIIARFQAPGSTPDLQVASTGGMTVGLGMNTGVGGYTGTTSNSNFELRTNNAARLTILSDGNVGIGTTGPGAKFDVRPDSGWITTEALQFGTAGQNPSLRLYRPTGDGTTAIPWYIRAGGDVYTTNFEIATGSEAAIGSESVSTKMVIEADGKVGIGTTNPSRKLHLYGTSNNASDVYSETDGARIIKHWFVNAGQSWSIGQIGTSEPQNYQFRITDETTGNPRLAISTDGNVGIGTTGPLAALSVGATSQFQVSSAGAVTAASINGNTITTGTGTLTLGAGKTFTSSNTLTLTATDGSTLAIGAGGTLGTAAYTATSAYEASGAVATHAALTATHGATGAIVGTTNSQTLTNKTLTSPIIANIAPGADFTLTQNSVIPFTSVNTGAVVDTLYLKTGNVGIGTTGPGAKLHVAGDILVNTGSALQLKSIGNVFLYAGGTSSADLIMRADNNIDFQTFISGWTSKMMITEAGNVGIGTTGPGAKLDVAGGAIRTDNQLVSTIATGTAPLAVSSTTVVSNLNADLLDGYHLSTTANAANTVPVRNASGYLNLGWINTTSGSAGTTAPDRIYGSYDAYIRYYTPANFATVMEGYLDDHFVQLAGDSSVTGNVNISGNVGIGTTNPLAPLSVGATSQFQVSSAGAVTAASINGNTITTGTGTLTLGAGKTFTSSNTLTLTATDGSTLAIGTGGTLGTAAYTATSAYEASGAVATHAALTAAHGATGAIVGTTNSQTLTNKTLTSPIIANIAPGADFTLTQNSVIPFTSVNTGAVVDTLYLKTGNVGIGTTGPAKLLDVNGTTRFSGASSIVGAATIGTSSSIGQINLGTGTQAKLTTGASFFRIQNWIPSISDYRDVFYADALGNVGIGTTGPNAKLEIGGTSSIISNTSGNITITPGSNLIISSGNVGIGTTSPGRKLTVSGLTGTASYNYVRVNTATGDFYYDTSTLRNKADIKPLQKDFSSILQVQSKSFKDKSSGQAEIGYIAEDLDALGLKDLVIYDRQGRPDGIKYDRLSVYLLEIIKRQQKEIEALKHR